MKLLTGFFAQRQPASQAPTRPAGPSAGTTSQAAPPPRAVIRNAAALPPEVFYPAQDPGLPSVDPQLIVDAIAPKILRLRELVVSEADAFDDAYLEPIRALARLIHLLPASDADHYASPAGLFNLCVDCALYARQSADGKIFTPGGTVEERHRNEPRWRYATFLAALTCQIYRSISLCTVTNEQGAEWPRFSHPLAEWLASTGSARYFVKWQPNSTNVTGAEGAAVLSAVAPKSRLDWLAQGDVQIVRDMHHVALGSAHKADSILASVVTEIVRRVMEVDSATRRSRYGRLTVGQHVEPIILDALRDAVESGRWSVNAGGPVWVGTDGLFIEWPAAHADVLAHFESRHIAGMPASSTTIAEMLGRAGVIIQAENGLWVREISVPGDGESRTTTALRFVEPIAVFGHVPFEPAPRPFGAELVRAESRASVSAPSAAKLPAAGRQEAAATSEHVSAPDTTSAPTAPAPERQAKLPHRAADDVASRPLVGTPSTPLPVAADGSGEIRFAELVSADARRWIKSADMAETIGQLIHAQRQHRNDVVQAFPWGLALSVEWIQEQTATEISEFIKRFDNLGWRGRPSKEKNEAVKVHEVQFGDGVKQAIVLNDKGARALGFDFRGAR